MPHVGGTSGGDDLASSDEIKVFKEEGDEDDNRSSENLTDVKTSLVTEGEEEKSSDVSGQNEYGSPKSTDIYRSDSASHACKSFDILPTHSGPIGYVVSPYAHPHNGSIGPVSMDIFPEGFSKDKMYQIMRNTETQHNLEMARKIDIFSDGFGKDLVHQLKWESLNEKANLELARKAAAAGKVPMVQPPHSGSPLPFMVYNGEPFAQPPPAHMGIPPVVIDPKTGIPRPPTVYHLGPPGQYPPVFSPDFTHQLQWHTPALYPTTSAGFRSAYSSVTSAPLPRFSAPPLLSPYPPPQGLTPHPTLLPTTKQDHLLHHPNHRILPEYSSEQKYNSKSGIATSSHNNSSSSATSSANGGAAEKKTHIKKPLNAFMLYMKEMRAKVVAECTLKESAAINQILGRRWHSLTREEQAKYYEMARKERQLHMQLYPGWSARDNYALQVKKKKRKKDRNQDGDGNNLKKCRARFGLDQQSSWCKPCRRKKKCIRYLDGNDTAAESEDNMGSAGSVEAPTPDSKADDTDSQDTSHPSPQLSPDPPDMKPRLDANGTIQPPSPPRIYQHHPLSVHQLIQPHFSSRSRFQTSTADAGAPPPHMLTVT